MDWVIVVTVFLIVCMLAPILVSALSDEPEIPDLEKMSLDDILDLINESSHPNRKAIIKELKRINKQKSL